MKKQSSDREIWEDTAKRYGEIYAVLQEAYCGIHSDPSDRIRQCKACTDNNQYGGECHGCPIMKEWGKCGNHKSEWTQLSELVNHAMVQCLQMQESAEQLVRREHERNKS